MGGSWKSEKFGLQVDGPLEIARWLIFHEEAKYFEILFEAKETFETSSERVQRWMVLQRCLFP